MLKKLCLPTNYPYPLAVLVLMYSLSNNLLQAAGDSLAPENSSNRPRAVQLPQSQQQQQQQPTASTATPGLPTHDTLPPLGAPTLAMQAETQRLAQTCQTDSQQAPTMVIIPPGQFLMGSSPDTDADHQSDEAPQHWVTIPKPFALSRCEITVGQFKQFVQESRYQTTAETDGKGCYVWDKTQKQAVQHPERNWQSPGFAQDDDHPVVCVSWQDTQHYLDWLSQRTGVRYRLPSEAEWEYAARARTVTPYFYHPEQQCAYANGAGQETKPIADSSWTLAACTDPFVYTAPVARFAENPFGLFDMAGNVWEWTQDCWHENYQDTPSDGSAWLDAQNGDCTRRVVRGGFWLYDPQFLRSAFRGGSYSVDALNYLGFRVARDFLPFIPIVNAAPEG